ncbi:MAG: DNA mismatch repair endonuclease MutL [Firmicutes bacterium]|nr:DNA mismatch repair endonuclease MutL [Bacillota bacterium]
MMQTRHAIRQLDPLVVGKIAAGEVVERPAFAIKELIENSVDAGATAITIEMRDGGLTYFRVTDNGCGIPPEDVRMAFARHATSKLRLAEELSAIHTLGFRGEALASIAAVAKVELTTRVMGMPSGVKAIVAGGVIESIQDAASPEGTSIVVRDLFYNVPARQKFLKKPATESSLTSDLVMRLLLARPDIAFRLMSAERPIYASPGNGSLRDALFSVLGREALCALQEVRGSAAGCLISGYVGVDEACRSSRTMQTFILNGRYVRNAFLSQALEEGCRERVMAGKHPVCALHLTMPFEAVDVNVHPNKLEARFADERALVTGLTGVIRAALVAEPMEAAPRVALAPPEAAAREPVAVTLAERPDVCMPAPQANRPTVRLRDSASPAASIADRPPVPTLMPQEIQEHIVVKDEQTAVFAVRVIGVAWLEYVLCEQGETLYIIDQHAAHERILYERYKKALDQSVASQQLLIPQVLQLTHREHTALMESLDDLSASGFDLADFGNRSIQARAVPMILGLPQLKPFFGELADRLTEYKALPTQEKRRDMLVKLSCRKAVKAGDALPLQEIEGLIQALRETGVPPTCPHGRPLVVRIDKIDLDKRFRRIP